MLKKYDELLNLEATRAKCLFEKVDNPWEVLPLLEEFIMDLIPCLGEEFKCIGENVYVHESVKVSDKATIIGPTIIDEGTEVRPGAYIRGKALIGKKCVIGNSTEVKNAIIFNNCQCPHYNYIGDAVLGEYAHTGAGVILSNVKSDKSHVNVTIDGKKIDTGLKKLSGILGDHVEVGCNSVICPGTIIYSYTNIYPLTRVRGTIKGKMIVKDMNKIVPKEEK